MSCHIYVSSQLLSVGGGRVKDKVRYEKWRNAVIDETEIVLKIFTSDPKGVSFILNNYLGYKNANTE